MKIIYNYLMICDSHNDFLTELPIEQIEDYIKKSELCGVKRICASYFTTKKKLEEIFDDLSARNATLKKSDSKFLLHIEDLWWVQDEKSLDFLLKLKPFSCSLTWNDKNSLASGAKSRGGLTSWGKRCLLRLKENGILIDVAHLNRQSFEDVTKLLPKNIYCSHTGFYGVKRRKRNLTDGQIDKIVKSNGFIGLFFFDDCLQKSSAFSIQDIVFSLNYFTTRWGCDNIGIGSDFYGIENYPKDLKEYKDFAHLKDALEEYGYTKEQIQKIFYKNFEDFLRQTKKK